MNKYFHELTIFLDDTMAESNNVMYSEVRTKGKKSKGEILFFLKYNIICPACSE